MSARRMLPCRRSTTSSRPRCEGRRPSRNRPASQRAVALVDARSRVPHQGRQEAVLFPNDAAEARLDGDSLRRWMSKRDFLCFSRQRVLKLAFSVRSVTGRGPRCRRRSCSSLSSAYPRPFALSCAHSVQMRRLSGFSGGRASSTYRTGRVLCFPAAGGACVGWRESLPQRGIAPTLCFEYGVRGSLCGGAGRGLCNCHRSSRGLALGVISAACMRTGFPRGRRLRAALSVLIRGSVVHGGRMHTKRQHPWVRP